MKEPANALDLLEQLRRRSGEETQRFQDITRYLSIKAREKGIPLTGQFELTPLCNFDCKMCYVHLMPEQMKGNNILSVDTWKDIMHKAWEAGMIEAVLTGGECLVYPGFKELFLYLHSLGCEVSVLTNGSLMDNEWVQFFMKHKPRKIQITLYGPNDDVYEHVTGKRAFHQVTENIRNAISTGLPVSLSVTPNKYMGESITETVRIARSLCHRVLINSAIFIPREETGRSEQHDNPDIDIFVQAFQLLNQMNGFEIKEIDQTKLPPAGGPCHECSGKGLKCGGGRSSFNIDWKGIMMPCNRLDMIHGNVLRDGFKAAWEKINREVNNWPRVPECDGCAYESVCNCCAANMLEYAEPGKQPIKLCEITRYYVRQGIARIPECE